MDENVQLDNTKYVVNNPTGNYNFHCCDLMRTYGLFSGCFEQKSYEFCIPVRDLKSFKTCIISLRTPHGSTLPRVMACFLTAPSHYLDQCSLIVSEILWRKLHRKCSRNLSMICIWNYCFKITSTSPGVQLVQWGITSHTRILRE